MLTIYSNHLLGRDYVKRWKYDTDLQGTAS